MRQPLGQHFLRDPHAIQTILAAAELQPDDVALEIGPGKGVLTEGLASRVNRLIAVELDRKLAEGLQVRFQSNPKVTILQGDILKIELPRSPSPIKIIGNLPYSITSPIFEKLMPWTGWDTGVFLIQREVADRIASGPGSRRYGILSLAVQLFADVETILQVRPGAFVPPPKVASTVIRVRRKTAPWVPSEYTPDFFDLLHGAFAHRRKTIANSLALFTGLKRSVIEEWLLRHKTAPTARAESIALHQYAQLAVPWSIFRREINLT